MKNSIWLKLLLAISGLVATLFGTILLVSPVWLYQSSGIGLDVSASMLSEIRAPGGALLAMGVLITAGAFVKRLTFTAVVISMTLYLAYGLSRVVSIVVDGMPVEALLQAAALEMILGIACLVALTKLRDSRHSSV